VQGHPLSLGSWRIATTPQQNFDNRRLSFGTLSSVCEDSNRRVNSLLRNYEGAERGNSVLGLEPCGAGHSISTVFQRISLTCNRGARQMRGPVPACRFSLQHKCKLLQRRKFAANFKLLRGAAHCDRFNFQLEGARLFVAEQYTNAGDLFRFQPFICDHSTERSSDKL
jgi:hypothetical protein